MLLAAALSAALAASAVALSDAPCDSKPVLARLDYRLAPMYRKALAVRGDHITEACWVPAGNMVIIVYATGGYDIFDIKDLRPAGRLSL